MLTIAETGMTIAAEGKAVIRATDQLLSVFPSSPSTASGQPGPGIDR